MATAAKTLPDDDDDGDASAAFDIEPCSAHDRIRVMGYDSSRLTGASISSALSDTITFSYGAKRKGGRPLVHVVVAMVDMNIARDCVLLSWSTFVAVGRIWTMGGGRGVPRDVLLDNRQST